MGGLPSAHRPSEQCLLGKSSIHGIKKSFRQTLPSTIATFSGMHKQHSRDLLPPYKPRVAKAFVESRSPAQMLWKEPLQSLQLPKRRIPAFPLLLPLSYDVLAASNPTQEMSWPIMECENILHSKSPVARTITNSCLHPAAPLNFVRYIT